MPAVVMDCSAVVMSTEPVEGSAAAAAAAGVAGGLALHPLDVAAALQQWQATDQAVSVPSAHRNSALHCHIMVKTMVNTKTQHCGSGSKICSLMLFSNKNMSISTAKGKISYQSRKEILPL